MKTQICPTCGCSLVRLGITSKSAVTREYKNKAYSFCCDGCAVMFDKTPEALLNDTKDLVVCPSCLAEKQTEQTIAINHKGNTIHFCKCPYCMTVFQKDPEYYLKRLSGEIKFSGVFSEGHGCCA
jgi:YHS domain-containing protein